MGAKRQHEEGQRLKSQLKQDASDDDKETPKTCKRWCSVFPIMQCDMAGRKVSEKVEQRINWKILKCMPRKTLPKLACVSVAMNWALKQLIRHPFNRGDFLVLTTPRLSEFIDKKPSTRLVGHLNNMFIRVNDVCPSGREIRVQQVDYIIHGANEGEGGDEVRPHIPKCKKRRRELAATESTKRVKRIAPSMVAPTATTNKSKNNNKISRHKRKASEVRYSDITTGDLHNKQNAFYVEYIKPNKTYARIAEDAPPFRIKDIEARFALLDGGS